MRDDAHTIVVKYERFAKPHKSRCVCVSPMRHVAWRGSRDALLCSVMFRTIARDHGGAAARLRVVRQVNSSTTASARSRCANAAQSLVSRPPAPLLALHLPKCSAWRLVVKWILMFKRAALVAASLMVSVWLVYRGYTLVESVESMFPLVMCLLLSISLNLTTFAVCMCDGLFAGLRQG